MRQREIFVIAIAVSILAGFLTGLFLWNYFREYDAPVLANVIDPTSTLPNPTVSTTLPEPTIAPTPEPTLAPQLMARISHYNPRLLGVNCHPDNIVNGECTSWLSDGAGSWAHWSFYENWGLACPKTYSLGTRFAISHFPSSSPDGYWTCVDRGGLINVLPDSIRLDLLTPNIPYVHQGDIVKDKFSPSGSYVVEVKIVHTP